MKNRVLSTVLAVLLLLSVFTVGSFAADQTVGSDSPAKVTLTVGNGFAAPGGTALVPVYAFATNLGENDGILRAWQVAFETSDGETVVDGEFKNSVSHVTGDSAFGFTNVTANQFGVTANANYGIVTNAQLTAFGGAELAQVAFKVPENATGTITVSIKTVDAFSFDDANLVAHPAKDITCNAGTITVVASGEADAYTGAGEDYTIPAVNEAGAYVTKIGTAVTGTYGTLVVPATVTAFDNSFMNVGASAIVLKNAQYAAGDMNLMGLMMNVATTKASAYYVHKTASGADTTATFITSANANATVKNILAAPIVVTGEGTLTVVGVIAVDDLAYEDITLSVTVNGKTYTKSSTCVGEAIEGVEGLTGKYFYAVQFTGVPAGSVTIDEAVMYGTTADATGTNVVVISEVTTGTYTVA